MRISDWSSDVCSSDLRNHARQKRLFLADEASRPPDDGIPLLKGKRRGLSGMAVDEDGLDRARQGAIFEKAFIAPPVDRSRLVEGQYGRDGTAAQIDGRSAERRAGKECVRTRRSRGRPYNKKK